MNGLQRKTYLRRSVGLRRGAPLRQQGTSETSQTKRRIQALLRGIVIERDGGCYLRSYKEAGPCGGYGQKSGTLILQADHISSRANAQTFGLTANVNCICAGHHTWKKWNRERWEVLTKRHIGAERFDRMIALGAEKLRQSFTAWDWRKVELGLKQELEILRGTRR